MIRRRWAVFGNRLKFYICFFYLIILFFWRRFRCSIYFWILFDHLSHKCRLLVCLDKRLLLEKYSLKILYHRLQPTNYVLDLAHCINTIVFLSKRAPVFLFFHNFFNFSILYFSLIYIVCNVWSCMYAFNYILTSWQYINRYHPTSNLLSWLIKHKYQIRLIDSLTVFLRYFR